MIATWSSTPVATTPDHDNTPPCNIDDLVQDWDAAPDKSAFVTALPLYKAAAFVAVARTRLPALPVKPRRKVLT